MNDIRVNLELDYTGYEQYMVGCQVQDCIPGSCDNITPLAWYEFKFPNGYGVIIGKGKFTRGYSKDLWQLNLVKYDGDKFYCIGEEEHLRKTDEEIREYLEYCKNL